ncbi:MAG TPA: hypothetical protein DCK93_03355 [Blastocatellia bacterium]|jgi:hypothetical protein|nr:hypothetical protein [Blastocatellia bacterium]HAF21944.1 hypothetical protein [Blastocatellia bacterium]
MRRDELDVGVPNGDAGTEQMQDTDRVLERSTHDPGETVLGDLHVDTCVVHHAHPALDITASFPALKFRATSVKLLPAAWRTSRYPLGK